MTLCPIAFVAGCRRCPTFSICPLKSVIGDQKKPEQDVAQALRASGPNVKKQ
jgi:hypothetical protein